MFFNTYTKEEALKLFRKLSFRLHPDHGGSNELMILLQEAYEERCKWIEELDKAQKKEQKKYYEKTTEKIRSGDDRLGILDEIYIFLLDNPDIKLDFVESVRNFYKAHAYITSGQYNALVKIYHQFEMDKYQKTSNENS